MLIEIFIATYNRLDFLKETLQSVLMQDVGLKSKLKITVSDNSTSNDTEEYFKTANLTDITYVRRRPSVSALDHVQQILHEVQGDYFMVFHDDDIMEPNMIRSLIDAMTPAAAAVSSNAYFFKGKKTNEPYLKGLSQPLFITEQKSLLVPYLKRKEFAPFPGYMYKKQVAQIFLDPTYGKHVDVHFLSQVLKLGTITVLDKPYYYYRIHAGQDSFVSDYQGKMHLINYIVKTCNLKKDDPDVLSYRLYCIYDEFRVQLINKKEVNVGRMLKLLKMCFKTGNLTLASKMIFRISQRIKAR